MNPPLEKLRLAAIVIGWAALVVIMLATLSPIDERPHIPGFSPNAERFLSYFAAGALLSFAYPRKRWLVLGGIVALAGGLEWLQTLESSRHGVPVDALVKCGGALLGGALAGLLDRMAVRLRGPARPQQPRWPGST